MIGRNDACWCGSTKKWKKCHFPLLPPDENNDTIKTAESLSANHLKRYGILCKTAEQIEGIRASCKLAAKILTETCAMAKAGCTTQQLNDFAVQLHKNAGAIAAPLGYGSPPFPKSICTSVNEVICHGIPCDTPLQDGDIVNIDITCILNGYFGDCSKMVMIGNVTSDKKLVCDVSYESLMRAIATIKPGSLLSDIGNTIEEYAHKHGCSVVTQFVGHGVGVKFHEPPQVPHYKNMLDIELIPGMTFTIEPMINAGKKEAIIDPKDQWTARTIDAKPSAQWEHTILVTPSGHEILTNWTR